LHAKLNVTHQRIEHPYRCPTIHPCRPVITGSCYPRNSTKMNLVKGQSARNPWLMISRKPGSVHFAPSTTVTQSLSWWNRTFEHPLTPYSVRTPGGIRERAVKQMYEFCHKRKLPEAWAYLWEIWARSCNPCIPASRTTMILESQ
jgi:hypothetical protein